VGQLFPYLFPNTCVSIQKPILNSRSQEGDLHSVSSRPGQNKPYADIKIQPPLLALLNIALAFLLTWLIPLPLSVPPILRVSGFPLVVLGFLLGMGALIAFRHARMTHEPRDTVTRLVTSGIYRFTRNPVYLGFLLMQVGLLLNAGSYWGILLTPIMVLLFNRLVIEQEELSLTQKFGDGYRSYKSKVGRWI
jgi:protein-S-isoprenylcysteine O-methyltransferase Ste14